MAVLAEVIFRTGDFRRLSVLWGDTTPLLKKTLFCCSYMKGARIVIEVGHRTFIRQIRPILSIIVSAKISRRSFTHRVRRRILATLSKLEETVQKMSGEKSTFLRSVVSLISTY